MDIDRIAKILAKNENKNFVKRIMNPKVYPVLRNANGTVSTHSMATAEVDGKHIAYPTVIQDTKTGRLKRMRGYEEKGEMYKESAGNNAVDHALQTGEYIEFDKPDDANWFATNYKKIWGKW